MSAPQLSLGVSAPGAEQVIALARAVQSLTTNLETLKGVAGGANTLNGLAGLERQLKAVRTDLRKGFEEFKALVTQGITASMKQVEQTNTQSTNALMANMREQQEKMQRQINDTAEKIAQTQERAAAKIRVAGERVNLGGGLSSSSSGSGLSSEAEVRALQAQIRNTESALAARAEAYVADGAKLKALWVKRNQELEAQMAAERTAMNQAVLQYKAAQEARLAAQVAVEAKQKAQWFQYQRDLEARMAAERTAMNQAVVQYRASQEARLVAQVEAEAKQKAQWFQHQRDLEARMAAERSAMNQAVVQYRAIQAAKLAEQVKTEAAQKAQWFQHQQDLEARLAAERTAMDQAVRQYRAIQDAKLAEEVKAAAKLKAQWRAYLKDLEEQLAKETALRQAATIRGYAGQQTGPQIPIGPGTYSVLGGATHGQLRQIPGELEKVTKQGKLAAQTMHGFAAELNDAHSAARGLASGFGMLWLTWGTLGPLLAGAAISHSFSQTLKLGAEVQHQFEIIRVLSDESASAVGGMSDKLQELARTGPFGPQAVAEAMKTLSLAGLNAKEATSAVADVLNFAVAGTTSIAQAADVMTTVGVAFKITAQDYNVIGDVIAKAAAISKSSVESMGNAFKSASTVNSLYGVSLQDVGTNLALLGNAGIQNSAAGTALTNMYIDLAGRTPKATKALKDLGVEAVDPLTGKMRNLGDIYRDLLNALAEKTPITQLQYINAIFAQRSRKDVVAIIDAMRTAAKEGADGVKSEFDRIAQEITNAAGFQATAAAVMMLTPMNQMKSVLATLQADFVEAFTAVQPYLLTVTQQLKEMFNSENFRNGLERLVTGIAKFTGVLVEHATIVGSLLTLYLGFKIFGAVSAIFLSLSERVVAYGVAVKVATTPAAQLAAEITAQAAAASAATGAMKALTREQFLNNSATAEGAALRVRAAAGAAATLSLLGRLVPWITAAWLGWEAYTFWSGQAADKSAQTLAGGTYKATLEALTKEADRLEDINRAKRESISLDELRTQKALDAAIQDANLPVQIAQRKLLQAEERVGTGQGALPGRNAEFARKEQMVLVARAQAALQQAKAQASADIAALQAQYERIRRSSAEQAARVAAEAKERDRKIPKGPGTMDLSEPVLGRDNELSSIRSIAADRLAELKKSFDSELQLLEERHRDGLISEGAYQAQLLQITRNYSMAATDELRAEEESYWAAWSKRFDLAENTLAKDPAKLAQTLKNLWNEADVFVADFVRRTSATKENVFVTQERGANSLGKQLVLLSKTNDLYWLRATANEKKEIDQINLRRELADASEEVRVRREAELKVEDRYAAKLEEMDKAYRDAQRSVEDFNELYSDGQAIDEKALARYSTLVATVEALAKQLKEAKDKLAEFQKQAGNAAVVDLANKADEAKRKEIAAMANTINEKLAEAILGGGKNGFKAMRDWVQNYFIREPLKIFLKTVLSPIGNYAANMVSGSLGLGTTGSAAAGGAAGSFGGSAAGSIFGSSIFGNGLTGGVGTGGLSGVMSGLSAWGQGGSVMGMFSNAGLYSGAELLGAAVPIIGAALAIYTIAKAFTSGGETRSGGQYAWGTGNDIWTQQPGNFGTSSVTRVAGPSGGALQASQVETSVLAATTSINDMLRAMGSTSTLVGFQAGLETSSNNRGGVFAGGVLSSGATFGMSGTGSNYAGDLYDPTFTFSPDAKKVLEDFSLNLLQTTVQALQAATDIPESVQKILEGVDAKTLTTDTATALLTTVSTLNKSVAELAVTLNHLPLANVRDLSYDARAALLDLAGGLDKLVAGINEYYTNFYSEEERRAQTILNIQETLAKAGMSYSVTTIASATRATFRALVESLNLTTTAGQTAYAALMSVAGAFASITQPATTTTGGTTLDDLQQNVTDAHDQLVSTLTREVAALTTTIEKWRSFGESLRKLRDDLLFDSALSPLTPKQQYEEASRIFEETRAKALSGDETAMGQLQGAAQNFLQASRDYNASGSQYLIDFSRVQSVLAVGVAKAESQVTILAQQKTLLEQQLTAAQGTQAGVISVAQAIQNLATAITSFIAAGGNMTGVLPDGTDSLMYVSSRGGGIYNNETLMPVGGGSFAISSIQADVNSLLANGDYMTVYNATKAGGYTLADLDKIMGWAGGTSAAAAQSVGLEVFAKGGAFHGGIVSGPTAFNMGLMGEAGAEAIMPLTNVGGRLGVRAATDGAVAAQMQALIEEVRQLREANVQGTRAVIAANFDANEQAAQTVVDGSSRAIGRIRYNASLREEARTQ